MVVEIKKDVDNRFFNYYKRSVQDKLDKIREIIPFKDMQLDVYFSPGPEGARGNNEVGMFFTDKYDYFSGRFDLIYQSIKVGTFTISCFPNCCGMAILTANYGTFRTANLDKGDDFILLLACYLCQHRYPEITAVDKIRGVNYQAYLKNGFKEIHQFKGNGGSELGQLSMTLNEKDILGEITKLYKDDIDKEKERLNIERQLKEQEDATKKRAALQNKNKKQASKSQSSEKLIAIAKTEGSGKIGINDTTEYIW